jgi:hypothetical protein
MKTSKLGDQALWETFNLLAACLQSMMLVGKEFSAGWLELLWGISTGSGPLNGYLAPESFCAFTTEL